MKARLEEILHIEHNSGDHICVGHTKGTPYNTGTEVKYSFGVREDIETIRNGFQLVNRSSSHYADISAVVMNNCGAYNQGDKISVRIETRKLYSNHFAGTRKKVTQAIKDEFDIDVSLLVQQNPVIDVSDEMNRYHYMHTPDDYTVLNDCITQAKNK